MSLNKVEIIEREPKFLIDITTAVAVSVYADTLPIPFKNNVLGGWKYEKTSTGTGKFNYYFKAHEPLSPIHIDHLENFYMVVTCDVLNTVLDVPFLVLYTNPTGVNDDQPWYHSKISYSIDITKHQIFGGDKCLLWAGRVEPKGFPNLNKIRLTNEIITGEGGPHEILNYLTAHSHSTTAVNYKCTVHTLGWGIKNIDVNMDLI